MPVRYGIVCDRCRKFHFISPEGNASRIHYDRMRGEFRIICTAPCSNRLPHIRAATYKRTLLFYADSSLAFEDVAEAISDVEAQLPKWDVFVVTPTTVKPCEQWLDTHSGPAG